MLIPVDPDTNASNSLPSIKRSVVIRTFLTMDFMTGVPAVPGKEVQLFYFEMLTDFLILVPLKFLLQLLPQ